MIYADNTFHWQMFDPLSPSPANRLAHKLLKLLKILQTLSLDENNFAFKFN
jgi:hypothetical protein